MEPNSPTSVCLFFQAHQPFRIKNYDFFQIGSEPDYFDHETDHNLLNRVCDRSYLPALNLFEHLHEKTNGNFSFGLGITGTLVTQLERHRPEVLKRFQDLVSKDIAILTGGTYSNSIATYFSSQEAMRQIQLHRKMLWEYFEKRPTTFANTELIYRDDLVQSIKSLGYSTILAEGVPEYLGHRSPDFLYHTKGDNEVNLLLRNYGLSDDVGFRFADTTWKEYPLTAERFTGWLQKSGYPLKNIFLDLETIGEHQGAETGIFQFWQNLILLGTKKGITFESPDQVLQRHPVVGEYSSPKHSSWADASKDKSAWQANVMQQEASQKLFRLQHFITSSNSVELLEHWTLLQSADHFLYMSTKEGSEGEVHQRFSHLKDPYLTYSSFMNILADLKNRAQITMAQQLIKENVVG